MSNHLDYEINKELGECYLFMGDLDKAEEYYRKAANNNGVHPDPYLGLATVAVQRGELERAHVLYKKAHDIEPGDKPLAGMGLIEAEMGNHENAHAHFTKALEANPENLVALFGIIQAGHVVERLDEVISHLENYLAIDPLKHDVRFSLAGCLAWMDRKEEAREQLERILEQDSDYEPAQDLLTQL